MKKELRKIVKDLQVQGFEARERRSGHVMIFRDGRFVTTFGGTPSDVRSHRNSMAACKRVLRGQVDSDRGERPGLRA